MSWSYSKDEGGEVMFKNAKVFSSFSVDDSEKAKQFYSEVLGMEITPEKGMEQFGILALQISGSDQSVMIYPKGDDHKPATFTVLNFPVDDIDKAIDELKEKGIEFEDLKNPDMPQDEKKVLRGLSANMGPDIAWFRDPAGNVLSVLQEK